MLEVTDEEGRGRGVEADESCGRGGAVAAARIVPAELQASARQSSCAAPGQ